MFTIRTKPRKCVLVQLFVCVLSRARPQRNEREKRVSGVKRASESTHTQTTASSAPPHSMSVVGNKRSVESECEGSNAHRRKIPRDQGTDPADTRLGSRADVIKAVAGDVIDDDRINDHDCVL